jgi:hypothetical protein
MDSKPAVQTQRRTDDVHPDLLEADDHKIRRVLAVVDNVSDPAVNKALLDPLRSRLATLRPVRPLRFARLLFMPIDPLTVPARSWRVSSPTVPRPALAPIARMVRDGLGQLTPAIDKIIAGRKANATDAVDQAGDMLWPRAAEILATSAAPEDWSDTDLPLAAYAGLAASIAAVLRRAQALRSLARDEEPGVREPGVRAPDDWAVEAILANIANEPEAGCAMIAHLILLRSPHAVQILARIAGAGRTSDEKVGLRLAVNRGVEAVMLHMERDAGFVHAINHGGLDEVAGETRRVTVLLRAIEADQGFTGHWPRLKAIRQKLDDMCRTRLARGLNEGLVAPLAAASGPMTGQAQTELETAARDIRKLDMAARKLSGSAGYDRLLQQAADNVRIAAGAGTLTPMRQYRLIEILAGPDAAEALYNSDRPS